nr:unnamed protein product [Callosobruchus analis]
MPSTNRVPPSL